MTPEELAAQEAKKAEEEAEANSDATDEDLSEEEKEEEENSDDSKQLKVQLQREREAREKAENAAADASYKLRESRRKKAEDAEEEEEKFLTPNQFQEILAKEREITRKELSAKQSSEMIEKYTDNEIERELIAEIHKNRTFPSHLSLEEQIEESYLIANKGKILGENKELKRALRNKSNVSKGANGTFHDSPQKNQQPKIDPKDLAVYTQLGYKWDNNKNLFIKKLPNGNLLARDIKTKKTFLLKD